MVSVVSLWRWVSVSVCLSCAWVRTAYSRTLLYYLAVDTTCTCSLSHPGLCALDFCLQCVSVIMLSMFTQTKCYEKCANDFFFWLEVWWASRRTGKHNGGSVYNNIVRQQITCNGHVVWVLVMLCWCVVVGVWWLMWCKHTRIRFVFQINYISSKSTKYNYLSTQRYWGVFERHTVTTHRMRDNSW